MKYLMRLIMTTWSLSILFCGASNLLMGQDFVGILADQLINALTDSMRKNEEFVLHDSTTSKLGLDINAVCRVVLINGALVEGFVELTSDGCPNCFYLEDGKSTYWRFEQLFRVDFYLNKFTRQSDQNYTIFRTFGSLNDTIYITNVKGVFYLDWSSSSEIGTLEKTNIVTKDQVSYLEISNAIECKTRYELNDSLVIFQELAPDTYIRKHSGLNYVKVKFSEISSFEFVTKPDKKWLDIIDMNRIEANTKGHGKSNWYHLIRRDLTLMKHVQKCIDASGQFVVH